MVSPQDTPTAPFSLIFKNYVLCSNVVRTIVKSTSSSSQEQQCKFEVLDRLSHRHHKYGQYAQFGILASNCVYFLKGKDYRIKMVMGVLYLGWNQHYYNLGSHVGVLVNLPWAIQVLQMADSPQPCLTQQLTNNFIDLLHQRENGQLHLKDNQIIDTVFLELQKQSLSPKEIQRLQNNSEDNYLNNDYFSKHFQKYSQESSLEEQYKVFDFDKNMDVDDRLRLPVADCFLSRYCYYSFTRYFSRVAKFLGIKEDV